MGDSTDLEAPAMTAPVKITLTPAHKAALLVEEATRWLGVQEVGGNNRGQLVELFLKSCKLGAGNPWCMAAVQTWVAHVDRIAALLDPSAAPSKMARGAHCTTVWLSTPVSLLTPPADKDGRPLGRPGDVAIWRQVGGNAGHTGVVKAVNLNGSFTTIEGNTSSGRVDERDGDGIFLKTHTPAEPGKLRLVGFISPWGKP